MFFLTLLVSFKSRSTITSCHKIKTGTSFIEAPVKIVVTQ